jgi:hypothetical protein
MHQTVKAQWKVQRNISRLAYSRQRKCDFSLKISQKNASFPKDKFAKKSGEEVSVALG